MKSTHVTSMGASLLLIALIGQVGSFKLAKQTAVVVQPSIQQQEEAIHREQLQQQRQFELLQQQQHQAEYQIQQQQLEADRFMKQHQAQQEFAANQGVKGAPLAPPAPLAPAPASYRPAEAYERQQYAQGPRPTIAYLLVRPPYPAPLPYDESAYRSYLPPMMARPQAYPEYPRQTVSESYGTKGGRQEEVAAPPPPPPPPQQPPVEQPALVVPISGDKHGKFKAMLDKLMSKLSFSSYEVAGEEYIYPAPNGGQVKQEAPIVQQKQPLQPIVQQHEANIEQQQFREEEQQQKQELNLSQQQQQQVSVESERDQGFDEAVKSPAAPVVQKPLEQTKQEVKEELVQQQVQQVQEQDFSRQPLAPAKGGQQPVRQQPEPIQQQRQEDTIKAPRKYVQQQQQYLQQEPLRQEQKGGF